jgi:tol-pal system protein YbgF
MKRLPYSLLLATLLLGGCVTGSDIESLRTEIRDLEDEVSELKRQASSKEEVQQLNQTLATQTQTLLKSNADISVKVDAMDERLQNATGNIEQTNYRVDRIAQQLAQAQRDVNELKSARAATASPAGTPGAATPITDEMTVADDASTESPLEIYQSAYRDYQRGNFDLAIDGFRDYLKRETSSDLSDNAAYWVGESLFSQKKYEDSISQFDSVINTFPKSDKVPAALLKKGYAYIELGERAQGIVQLQYVVHEHPRSAEAALARQRLKALGIESR